MLFLGKGRGSAAVLPEAAEADSSIQHGRKHSAVEDGGLGRSAGAGSRRQILSSRTDVKSVIMCVLISPWLSGQRLSLGPAGRMMPPGLPDLMMPRGFQGCCCPGAFRMADAAAAALLHTTTAAAATTTTTIIISITTAVAFITTAFTTAAISSFFCTFTASAAALRGGAGLISGGLNYAAKERL